MDNQPFDTCIVITGDPVDGFTFSGTFRTITDAEVWACREAGDVWYIAPLKVVDKS